MQLKGENEDLRTKLGQNSSNSSKPPSAWQSCRPWLSSPQGRFGQEARGSAWAQGVAATIAHAYHTAGRLLSRAMQAMWQAASPSA
jgi:hypothetical protein